MFFFIRFVYVDNEGGNFSLSLFINTLLPTI